MSTRLAREAGVVGASLVAAFAVARLASGAYTATMVTALIGTTVVTALRRRMALALTAAVLVVAACALWFGTRAARGNWVPTSAGLRSLHRSLQTARTVLGGFHLPLHHTPGIVALAALAGGLVAVGARSLAVRSPSLGLIPATVLVVWSASLLPSTGAAVAALLLGLCGFLVLGSDLPTAHGAAVAVAALSLTLAAVAVSWTAVAGSTVVAGRGRALPEVAPSALSLATDLTGVETRDARVVLFRATTSVSTYWQVTSLTEFSGGQWLAGPVTSALLEGGAPTQVTATTPGPSTFTAEMTLATYSGRLLPAPPSTVLASGSTTPVITPAGVVATSSYESGSTYTVKATVPSPVTDATTAAPSASAPADDTATGPLPAGIQSLALSLTGGQTTVLDKAEALVDFFRSGRFHYRVDASQPAGTQPLVSFLTRTRTGSCEQFAGAFAMLARAAGLPTRVAIGFTPGRTARGVTVVRGSDAHAWPQVLIDGNWVSFEPTPQLPSGELSPPGVLGPAGLGRPTPTTPVTRPPVTLPGATVPVTTVPHSPAPATESVHSPAADILAVVLLVVGVVVVGIAALILWRRGRRRRPPADRVVDAWRSIDRALARRRMARPRWRTPVGHVRDLAADRQAEQAGAALEDMRSVAAAFELVTYGTSEITPEQAEDVVQAGHRARRAVLAGDLTDVDPPGGRSLVVSEDHLDRTPR